jgi:hypothetical protein
MHPGSKQAMEAGPQQAMEALGVAQKYDDL